SPAGSVCGMATDGSTQAARQWSDSSPIAGLQHLRKLSPRRVDSVPLSPIAGAVKQMPLVSLPNRDYHLLEGRLEAATDLGWYLPGGHLVRVCRRPGLRSTNRQKTRTRAVRWLDPA